MAASIARGESQRRLGRRACLDVDASALAGSFRAYVESVPDYVVFDFGEYMKKGRSKAADGASLCIHHILLRGLIAATSGLARVKPKQLSAAVLQVLGDNRWAYRRLNRTALPNEIFADKMQIKIGIMLSHLRRLKSQPVKKGSCFNRLDQTQKDILEGLLEGILTQKSRAHSDSSSNSCDDYTPPPKKTKHSKAETDTDSDAWLKDLPATCAEPEEWEWEASLIEESNPDSYTDAATLSEDLGEVMEGKRFGKAAPSKAAGGSASSSAGLLPGTRSITPAQRQRAHAEAHHMAAQSPLPAARNALKQVVNKKPAAPDLVRSAISRTLGNLRWGGGEQSAYIQRLDGSRWVSVVNITAGSLARSSAWAGIDHKTFMGRLLVHVASQELDQAQAVQARDSWLEVGPTASCVPGDAPAETPEAAEGGPDFEVGCEPDDVD